MIDCQRGVFQKDPFRVDFYILWVVLGERYFLNGIVWIGIYEVDVLCPFLIITNRLTYNGLDAQRQFQFSHPQLGMPT